MTLIPRFVQRGFEATLVPVVNRLIAARVSPNVITSVGTLILIGSGVAFAVGLARLGGFLLLLSGVCDMLDGRVARGGVGTTRFGAFYDSTLDRVGESALYGGIAIYFVAGGVPETWRVAALVATLIALTSSLLISYTRARAEGLGLECRVGIAQRAERILGLGLPTMVFGAGSRGLLLLVIVALLAAAGVVTVIQRIVYVRKITRGPRRTQARWRRPALADVSHEGD